MITPFLKKSLISLAIAVICIIGKAQENKISIDITPTSNNQYSINCKSEFKTIGSYSIYIKFDKLVNIRSQDIITAVTSPDKIITTLSPINPKESWSIGRYSYRYSRGKFNTKPDSTFIYRLPVGTINNTTVYDMKNISEEIFKENSRDFWRPLYFSMNQGDTVYAARKGLVVETVDTFDIVQKNTNVSYSSNYNYVLIEHDDGTLARYYVLEKGSVMVAVGDEVFPDTPIALAGSYNGTEYQLRFNLTYLILDRKAVNSNDLFRTVFINPIFSTNSGNCKLLNKSSYTPVVTPELIEMEMSKKEKAKRK